MHAEEVTVWEQRLRTISSWVAVVGIALFTATFLYGCVQLARLGYWDSAIQHHFVAAIGLPAASLASLGIVIVLRTVAGPIQLRALGFEFSGAAGPIVMWVMCFLSMAIALKMMWPLTD